MGFHFVSAMCDKNMTQGRTCYYLLLVCIFAVPVLNITTTRRQDFRSGVFVLSREGHALKGYDFMELLVTNVIKCGSLCIKIEKCQSYNYGNTANADGKYLCQLNTGTAGSIPSDLVANNDFSYYEEPQLQEKIKCHDGLCQNGGTCKETESGYFDRCECATYFTGKYCDDSKARDCKDIFNMGGTIDDVYPINPDGQGVIQVLCDQTSDGGGWIVIQQRKCPFDTNFFVTWAEYEDGFGNTSSEFWLGNKAIHRITKSPKQLFIHLKSANNKEGIAKYYNFTVSSSSDNYRIDYSYFEEAAGLVGNALQGQKGARFSTYDCDNDSNDNINCAKTRKSGWWFDGSCGHSTLNQDKKPLWDTWFDYLQTSECKMKVRRLRTGNRV